MLIKNQNGLLLLCPALNFHQQPGERYSVHQLHLLSFFQLQVQGFIVKNATFRWTESRVETLKNALKAITEDPNNFHTQDPFYWISHYKFDGLVPVKDVRRKVIELLQDYETSVRTVRT